MSEPESPAQGPKKSSLATLRGLVPFLAPYKGQFVMAGIALVVAAGATLAIPPHPSRITGITRPC